MSLNPHSRLAHIDAENAHILGTLPSRIPTPKTNLIRTEVCDELEYLYPEYKVAPAPFRAKDGEWEKDPYIQNLTHLLKDKTTISKSVLDRAYRSYLSKQNLDWRYKELTTQEVINGIAEEAYINPMKRNTAAGIPWAGTKKQFLNFSETEGWSFKPTMQREYNRMGQLLRQGICPRSAFKGCLKEETLPIEKVL